MIEEAPLSAHLPCPIVARRVHCCSARAPRRRHLLTSSSLIASAAIVAGVIASATPVLAQSVGGDGGGSGNPGSTTGTGGQFGDAGGNATNGGGAGGGGGNGGAGGTATGSGGNGGSGGAAGGITLPAAAQVGGLGGLGGLGANGTFGSGGGGGGGGGDGAALTGLPVNSLLQFNVTGGAGGNGGNGGNSTGAGNGGAEGGNGGGGGSGLNAFNTNLNINANVQGGVGGNGGGGGNGGSGANFSFGGNAGAGGTGINWSASGGTTLIVSGTVTGGNGGSGGIGIGFGNNGLPGNGGAGIVVNNGGGGQIQLGGTVSGGLSGDGSTQANALEVNGAVGLAFLNSNAALNGNIQLGSASTLTFDSTSGVQTVNNFIFDLNGTGSVVQNGSGSIVILGGTNFYLGGTTIGQGAGLGVTNNQSAGDLGAPLTFDGGTLIAYANGLNLSYTATVDAHGGTIISNGNTLTYSGNIGGVGGLTVSGGNLGGNLILTGSNNYQGGTTLDDGTLTIGNNSALGSGPLSMMAGSTLSFLNSANFNVGNNIQISGDPFFTPPSGTFQTLSGVISDGGTPGTLEMSGGGTLVLTNINTYTGATNVNSGALDVIGSIATSSLTSVNNGAELTGTGTVGNAQVNSGGAFLPGIVGAPGTTMTVAGNLAFQSGAIYFVQLNPTTASRANVSGTAALGGTVDAIFAPGTYVAKQYDILHSAGLNGTKFASLATFSPPANFVATLSYSSTDVFLNLQSTLGGGGGGSGGGSGASGFTINQQNVATSLNNFFNGGGALPPNFATVFDLTGTNLANALTQLDGEVATDARNGAFQLTTEFLSLMLDPFVAGRGNGGGGALGFAPEQQPSLPPDIANAYNAVLKAPAPSFTQRWSAWGAAYGGSNKTSGDPAVVGSTDVTAHAFGYAAGMDYRLSPDTTVGFALAGGGTNWGLAQGLGNGRSDAFQAGIYGATHAGPAYLAAAVAFTDHWMTTNRTAFAADQLTAQFAAQSYGGRVETGYRVAPLPLFGATPYAALQAQAFHTPAYSETDLTGGGFGLSYASANATDTRSELGTRLDTLVMLGDMPLTLRGRAAWAHDWISNPALGAVFQALPGASFVVNGATPPQNSALASANAELHVTPAVSLSAKFDGEWARGSQTYASTGTIRYSW
jgi:uncharacterized protein with beta-barrel porin domain